MRITGFLLLGLGVLSFLQNSSLSALTYPLLWWGALLVLDAVNFKKWGASPMRSNPGFFVGLALPLSVIYWLFFELVNFAFPQWYYVGIIQQPVLAAILTFVSFATVIPAIIEFVWLLAGRVPVLNIGKGLAPFSVLVGIFFAALPFFSTNFWLNQAVWIAPFLILAPFLNGKTDPPATLRVWRLVGFAGLLSGFLWEFFNSFAAVRWEYGILTDQLHLFEMPLLGYLGFIPFAFSTVAVYLFAKKFLRPGGWLGGLLYAAAFLLSYIFVLRLI